MVKKHPILYREYGHSEMRTCMHYGFAIYKGWYTIIEALSNDLEILMEHSGYIIVAKQVKEKFGGLRFYTSIYDSIQDAEADLAGHGIGSNGQDWVRQCWWGLINRVVAHYEDVAGNTCERCGEIKQKCKCE